MYGTRDDTIEKLYESFGEARHLKLNLLSKIYLA